MATNGHPHPHLHSVKVMGSGSSLEQAFNHALAGLTDPGGHHALMSFQTFEVTKIAGAFSAEGSHTVQVALEATGLHKD